MDKKYELTNEVIVVDSVKLFRIKAIKDFPLIKCGELGGYIENESNLSHQGNCWVFDNAKVYEYSHVYGNAEIRGNVTVCGSSHVYGNACITGSSYVGGNSTIFDDSYVHGMASIINSNLCKKALVRGNSHLHNTSTKREVCNITFR
jgi:NDP-sugar pyrophosphorylase family protein